MKIISLPIICPYDHESLKETSSGLSCTACGRHYLIQDGVLCTLDHPDAFYEGAYENQTRYLPRIDQWGCRHWPNLFGSQVLIKTMKR